MSDTVRSLIDRNAIECSDRSYLTDPDSNLTINYSEFRDSCLWFGAQLRSAGFLNSAHVGFLMDNGCWTTVVVMGTMYSGHVIVPLNAVASQKNLRFAIKNADVDIIFVGENYRSLLSEIMSEFSTEVQVITVDMDSGFQIADVSVQGPRTPQIPITVDSPAMILHTSGTVGMPKGAVLTHGNLVAGGMNVKLAHRLSGEDVAHCVLPLYHINGQVVTGMASLVSGSSIIMPRKFSITNFWEHVRQYECSWLSVVPTIAKYLLDDAHENDFVVSGSEFRKLRFARSASSAMPAGMHSDFEKTFGIPMLETMGLTETAAPILSNPMPPEIRIPGSVGIPFGNEVTILNSDEEEMSANEIGEIVVRGVNVIAEYYNAPEATASSFTQSGWFRTGDLGYRDEDGYFFVTGRIKELIIKGGENISPREVDDVLYHHDAVLEAGAFGLPDDTYGQVVAVAVVLKEGRECTENELIDFCKLELGRFRCPSRIFFVEDLPKGPSGKIQRLQVANSLVEQMQAGTL